MKERFVRFFVVSGPLLLLALLQGCAGPAEAPDAQQMEAWKAEIMEADRAFDALTAQEGADGWVSFFSDAGAMVVEGVGEVRGTDAIRQMIEPGFADPSASLRWEPQRAEVSQSGDLGYTVGRFRNIVVDSTGAEQVVRQGLYVSIWRRQADGSWKVEMDLGNPTG